MAISREVQDAVAKVREMKDYIKADKEADKLRDKQLADAKAAQEDADSKLSALQAKLDALPVNRDLSQEDKDALQHAFDDAQEASAAATDAQANVTEVHDELKDAVPANTSTIASAAGPDDAAARNAQQIAEDRGKEKEAGPQPVEPIQAPLMPTLAFDPAGSGPHVVAPSDGQPQQAPAIETAGGFVIQGGASTQRAPGSSAQSPSSSLVIPTDPDAPVVAPVGTIDPTLGMPREPTPEEQEVAAKQQALVAAEMEARRANPLNLSPEDLEKRRLEEANRAGIPATDFPDESQRGVPDDSNLGPAPANVRPATDKAADGGEKRGE